MESPEDGVSSWQDRYALALRLIAGEAPDGVPGVAGALQRVCRSLTTHLSVMGAAINLMSDAGSVGVAAASDPRSHAIDELQFTTGVGPCHDAYAARRPVLTPDLVSAGAGWPGYTSAAVAAGVGAVFAFPLHVGAAGFGVMDVYAERAGSLDERQLAMALTFTQIATELLVDGLLTSPDGELEPTLGAALDSRGEIHQAQGMMMVSLKVGAAESLARMRSHAFAHDISLIDLARHIIAGRAHLDGDP